MASFKTFEDLDCWKEAVVLRKLLRLKLRSFPSEEKYRLVDQLVRASRSVTANIAEGFGRYHFQENIQFCRHSRGSLFEIIDHLIVAHEEEYLTDNELLELKEQTTKCIAILNGFIHYLQKAKQTNN